MKNLLLTVEGSWIELKTVQLTPSELELLSSDIESDKESKELLISRIKSEREVPADVLDAELAQDLYDRYKPKLNEGDVYQLISMNVNINEEYVTGVLNCRVNGSHIQSRVSA